MTMRLPWTLPEHIQQLQLKCNCGNTDTSKEPMQIHPYYSTETECSTLRGETSLLYLFQFQIQCPWMFRTWDENHTVRFIHLNYSANSLLYHDPDQASHKIEASGQLHVIKPLATARAQSEPVQPSFVGGKSHSLDSIPRATEPPRSIISRRY